jgi:hypothetical protein
MATFNKKIIQLCFVAFIFMTSLLFCHYPITYSNYPTTTLTIDSSTASKSPLYFNCVQSFDTPYSVPTFYSSSKYSRLTSPTPKMSFIQVSQSRINEMFAGSPEASFQKFRDLGALANPVYLAAAQQDPDYDAFIIWAADFFNKNKHIIVPNFEYKHSTFGTTKNDFLPFVNKEADAARIHQKIELQEKIYQKSLQQKRDLAREAKKQASQREHALIEQMRIEEQEEQFLRTQDKQRGAPRMVITQDSLSVLIA